MVVGFGCTSPSSTNRSDSIKEVAPPTTVDASALAGSEAVRFESLVGVHRDEAIAWAKDSGFAAIVDAGDRRDNDAALIPHRRITFTFDQDGLVIDAVAG